MSKLEERQRERKRVQRADRKEAVRDMTDTERTGMEAVTASIQADARRLLAPMPKRFGK